MELRFNDFRNIITGGYIGNEIKLRNNNKIRRLFAEDLFIMFITKKVFIPKIKEMNTWQPIYLIN